MNVIYVEKVRVKDKNQHFFPQTVTTMDVCDTIKAAAKVENPTLYAEIHDLDLIAKEFKYHRHCYKSFTRSYGKKERDNEETPVCSDTNCRDKGT